MMTDEPTRDIALDHARQLGAIREVITLMMDTKGSQLNREALDALNRPVVEGGGFLASEDLLNNAVCKFVRDHGGLRRRDG